MNTLAFRLALRTLLAIASSVLCTRVQPAHAQAPTPLPRSFEQNIKIDAVKISMDDVLAAITRQTQVSILVDDEPGLQNTNLTLDGSLRDSLDKVADTFDYTWRISKASVVLMSKRFKNPDERPQVNVPEMLEMTRSMVRALTMVDYDKDADQWKDLVKRVFHSFSPNQIMVLDAGGKLYGADLLPDQRAALQQASLANAFLESFKMWDGMIPLLENIKRSNIQARPRTPIPSAGPNAPTHDYFYLYGGVNGLLHAIEIHHIIYGDNDGEVRTP